MLWIFDEHSRYIGILCPINTHFCLFLCWENFNIILHHMQIFFKWAEGSDVFGDPKPKGDVPKSLIPEPDLTLKSTTKTNPPTSANPKFYLKNPRNPENPRGTSLKCWSLNPTQTRKADPESDPTPTFAPRIHPCNHPNAHIWNWNFFPVLAHCDYQLITLLQAW